MSLDADFGLDQPTVTGIEIPEVNTPVYPPMKEGEKAGNYNCLILDTVNELQDLEYLKNLEAKGKADFQAYIDLNVQVKVITNLLKGLFDEIVLIIGPEASGKSFGIKYLDPRTTIWLNTDDKPATFKGGRSNYSEQQRNMLRNLKDYPTLKKKIETFSKMMDKSQPSIVFMMAHLGVDKDTGREKMKVIGKFSEKLNLDGAVTNAYYTRIQTVDDMPEFYMDTQPNGNNSARCVEGLFPTRYIPNNLEYIRQALVKY